MTLSHRWAGIILQTTTRNWPPCAQVSRGKRLLKRCKMPSQLREVLVSGTCGLTVYASFRIYHQTGLLNLSKWRQSIDARCSTPQPTVRTITPTASSASMAKGTSSNGLVPRFSHQTFSSSQWDTSMNLRTITAAAVLSTLAVEYSKSSSPHLAR